MEEIVQIDLFGEEVLEYSWWRGPGRYSYRSPNGSFGSTYINRPDTVSTTLTYEWAG